MSGRNAFFLALVVAVALTASCVFAATRIAASVELAHISIRDSGTHVNLALPIPASVVEGIISAHLTDCSPEHVSAIRGALAAARTDLAAAGDFTLLEVQDRNDHVTIRMEGTNLRLHVESPGSRVDISVPQRVLIGS